MRNVASGFVLGVLVGGFLFVCVLQHTDRLMQGAMIVREDNDSVTLRFNHDATDQVLSVRVPVQKFPTSHGHYSGVAVTGHMWEESDSVTEDLMMSNAFDVEKAKLRDKYREVPGWQWAQ